LRTIFRSGALVLTLRHPLHTAKGAASIDRLSGNRLVLGVASGDRFSVRNLLAPRHGPGSECHDQQQRTGDERVHADQPYRCQRAGSRGKENDRTERNRCQAAR
jgi:alkanesulfonate monooxygenase SsuD/methylene tetrahydromethanopterin reductase-like flavin-dependent oxidoreductase (luciferase family)